MTTAPVPGATPKVRQAAAQLGVDLATVKGTGSGGRISLADVRAAAQPATTSAPRPLAAAATPAYVTSQQAPNGASVEVDLYGPNPLLEQIRLSDPTGYARALQKGPAPTLFASGELPPLLASGESPTMLRLLPWFARHAAAAADRGRLSRMLEDAAEDPSGMLLTMDGAAGCDGVYEYRNRIQQWLQGGSSAQTIYSA